MLGKLTIALLGALAIASQVHSSTGNLEISEMIAGITFVVLFVVVPKRKSRPIAQAQKAPKPPRDWTPLIRTIQIALIIIIAIIIASLVGITAFGIMYASQIPTSSTVWQQSMVLLGLDPNTQKPTGLGARGETISLVRNALPDSPEREKITGEILEALLRNDLKTVQLKNAEAGRAYVNSKIIQGDQILDEKVKKSQNLITIQDRTIYLVILITVLCAIVNVWLKLDIPMIGKITIQFFFVSAAVLTAIWLMPPETQQELRSVYTTGMTIKIIPLVMTAIALAIGLAKEEFHTGNKYVGFFATLTFAIVLSLLGLGLDSLFQLRILTDSVIASRGLITLNDAYLTWQMSSLAGTGLTSIISTGLLLMQAYMAMPKDVRSTSTFQP